MTGEYNLSHLAVQALLIEKRMSGRNVKLVLSNLPDQKPTLWRWNQESRTHRHISSDGVGGTWLVSTTELKVTTADLHKFDSQSAFHNLEERPEAPIQRFLKDKGMSGIDVLLTAPGGTQSVWTWNAEKNIHRMEQGLNIKNRQLAEVVMTTEEMVFYD